MIDQNKFNPQSGFGELSDGRQISWEARGRNGSTPKHGGYPVDAKVYSEGFLLFSGTALDAEGWLASRGFVALVETLEQRREDDPDAIIVQELEPLDDNAPTGWKCRVCGIPLSGPSDDHDCEDDALPGQPVVLANGLRSDDYAAALTPEDPKDITIRTLKAEVERLANDAQQAADWFEHDGMRQSQVHMASSAKAARALLARLAVFAFLALLSLPVFAAPKAHRHVTKPLSAITVKVVAHESFLRVAKPTQRSPWFITTSDSDSCTAWVDTTAGNVPAAEIGAFRACRTAIDLAVDSAASRSGA